MRTNEEFKAEVMNRSKKMIKERKRNIKIAISCCIPLILCVILIFPISDMSKNGTVGDSIGGLMPEKEMAADRFDNGEMEILDGNSGSTDPSNTETSILGSSSNELYKSFSVSDYPDRKNTCTSYDAELTEKMAETLKSARNGNIGIYSYSLLYEMEKEGVVITLIENEDRIKEYILIDNNLFVDNVLYKIKDEYVESINYIVRATEDVVS